MERRKSFLFLRRLEIAVLSIYAALAAIFGFLLVLSNFIYEQ